MMDDSLLIFEPPIRNSGIVGGKFLERQRVYTPESEEIYTYQVRQQPSTPAHGCLPFPGPLCCPYTQQPAQCKTV